MKLCYTLPSERYNHKGVQPRFIYKQRGYSLSFAFGLNIRSLIKCPSYNFRGTRIPKPCK